MATTGNAPLTQFVIAPTTASTFVVHNAMVRQQSYIAAAAH